MVKSAVFWMLRCVAPLRTHDSKKRIASIVRVTRIVDLEMIWWRSYLLPKSPFLQEPHGIISQNTVSSQHRRENFKSYIALTGCAL
jgi:hypothetical protein